MKNPTTKKLLRAGLTLTMIALPQQGYTANQQDNPVQIDEVVVTASKTPKPPGNVSQKVDIIDSEEIDIVSGSNNLAKFLTYQPGISVSVLSRNDANWGGASGGSS